MTGYLQRLAASVSQPRPSLHPLVGSIFSGARQEMASPDLPQNDESTDDQNLVPATRTVSGSPEGPMPRHDPVADDRSEQNAGMPWRTDDRRIEQHRSEREIFHPLLPSKAPAVGVSAMPPETVPGDAASPQSPSVGSQRNRRDPSIAGAARAAHIAVEVGPTADWRSAIGSRPVSRLPEPAEMLAVVSGDLGTPARAEFSAPPRRSTQSNDIQIHIGRIEVTALAQPAPRPAAAPARKAMSLDEYLGRVRRGAR
jgi:hypothetical protein